MERTTDSFSEQRKERAREILASSALRMISEDTFLVPSQSSNAEYVVRLIGCEVWGEPSKASGIEKIATSCFISLYENIY